MAFKDLLLALTSYPEPTPTAAIHESVALAKVLGARITAVTSEIEIPSPISFYTDAVLNISQMIADARETSASNARELMAAFAAAAREQGVPHEQVLQECLGAEVPDLLNEYARIRDVTIIPLRIVNGVEQWYAENVIFNSGRPTLVLPEVTDEGRLAALGTVVLAWDFSRPASRATADALPLLSLAKHVRLVTVRDEKEIGTRRSLVDVADHLSRHGVEIVVDEINAERRAIGEVLSSYIAANNADLVVMGAYGHSRIRDFILGGATRSMLAKPPVPVLLSH